MSKFHIKENGEPGKCTAQTGNCPFGADAPHFSTKEDARTHFEHLQKVTGGSFGAKMAPYFKREDIPLLYEDSVESPAGVLILDDPWALDPYTVEDYGSYQSFRDAMGDYEDSLTIETTTQVFDDNGNLVHTEESYQIAVDEGGMFAALYATDMPKDQIAELAKGRLRVHSWHTPNKRVTVDAEYDGSNYDTSEPK